MKVAVVYATDFGDISAGGIQNFVFRVGHFAPPDYRLTYFGLGTPHQLPRDEDQFRSLGDPRPGHKVNATFLSRLPSVRRELQTGFDLIVAHRAEHVARLPGGIPIVVTLHGGTWNALRAGNRRFGLAYPAIEVAACLKATRVVSVAPDSHSWLARRAAGNIAPVRAPASALFRVEAPPEPRDDLLVTACRLVPEKRIDRLVRLAALTDRKLLVFGDGPCRSALEKLATERGARVEFRGTVSAHELAREYANGGIFCLSSTFEGYPLAAAEAAASGLPVLGVQSSAVRQLESLGAISTNSIPEAARALVNGSLAPADPQVAWRAYSPEVVAREFWTATSGGF